MKFLIWLVIGFAVVTWIMRTKAALLKGARGSRQKTPGKAVESMLQCTRCGVYIPASEALTDTAGLAFCSEEHRAQRDDR